MKLSRNIFIDGLNKETTPEIIDSKAYNMAKNVVLSTLGTNGSLHNIEGSEAMAAVDISWRPTGLNKGTDWVCTGLYASNDESKLYMFLYATTTSPATPPDYIDRSMLFEYDIATDVWITVLAGIDASMNWSGDVLDASVVSFRGQDFLFWLNYDGVPYMIEIAEAVAFTAGIAVAGLYTDDEFNSITGVAQAPPLHPPNVEYIKDTNITLNRYIIGIYNFKYRYIYTNGGVSAFSPVSKIFYDSVVSNGVDNSQSVSYNAIEIDYNENVLNIESIEIAFKRDTTWYAIPPIPSQGIADYTYTFLNNQTYKAVGEAFLETKYYDNVPINALAQAFIKNKLAYANYIDNYDSVTDLSMAATAIYKEWGGATSTIDFSWFTSNYSADFGASYAGNPTVSRIEIDLQDIKDVANIGDIIHFNIYEPTTYNNYIGSEFWKYKWSAEGTVLIESWSTILESLFTTIEANSTYVTESVLSSAVDNLYVDYTNAADILTLFLKSDYVDANNDGITRVPLKHSITPTGTVSEPAPTVASNIFLLEVTESNTDASFKNGASHQLGAVYYDGINRQNDVAVDGDALVDVKWLFERIPEALEENGAASMLWEIRSVPPVWATHYQLVYSKNTNTRDFETFLCDNMLPVSDFDVLDTSGNVRVVMSSLQRFQKANISTGVSYIFAEGDRIYLTGHWDETDTALQYTDTPLSAAILDHGNDDTDDYQYVVISPESFLMFENHLKQYAYSDTVWESRFVMEIRSTFSNSTDGLFYEFGETYDIGDAGLAGRYHMGETRDQNEDLSGSVSESFIKSGENRYYCAINGATPYTGWKVGDYVKIWKTGIQNFMYGFITRQSGDEELSINTIDDSVFDLPAQVVNIERLDAATGLVTSGDSYVRSRVYIPNWGVALAPLSVITQVDTKLPSDVFKVFNDGFGRAQGIKQDKVAIRRNASIVMSQGLNEDFNFFGPTSFPNTATNNFVDLDNSFSSINELVNLNDNLYVLQDSRIGIQQVAKDILTTASGDGSVSITSDVFGNFIPIADGVGTRGVRGYTQKYEGRLFFVDPEGKVAYVVMGKEIKDITSKHLQSEMVDTNLMIGANSFIIPNRKEYVVNTSGWYVFNTKENKWVCQLEFSASHVINANDKYYSVNGIQLIEHESDTATYNSMFQDEGFAEVMPSVVRLIANDPKFKVKSYKSVAVIGKNLDLAETTEIYTNESRTTKIISFSRQEGRWVADIGGGYAEDSSISDHLRGIGSATLNGGNSITTTEVPHYVLIGDNLWEDENLLGVIATISGNVITWTGTAPSGGGFFSSSKPTVKDGMDIKGDWISTDIVFGTSGSAEYITAIEVEGSLSGPLK